jgi:hypothetical protein
MIALTALEKTVLDVILSSVIPDQAARTEVLNTLKISKRTFSSSDNLRCVGFYTNFDHNNLLAAIPNAPPNFTVQAKHPDLTAKQAGFILFCDQSKMAIKFLEGYFYGDDTLQIAEILAQNHKFVLDNAVSFGSSDSHLGDDRPTAS